MFSVSVALWSRPAWCDGGDAPGHPQIMSVCCWMLLRQWAEPCRGNSNWPCRQSRSRTVRGWRTCGSLAGNMVFIAGCVSVAGLASFPARNMSFRTLRSEEAISVAMCLTQGPSGCEGTGACSLLFFGLRFHLSSLFAACRPVCGCPRILQMRSLHFSCIPPV